MSNSRVTRFNFAVGNEPQVDSFFEQAGKQASYLLEEVNELIEAINNRDMVEVLDAVVDIWYIREYLDDLLTEQGVKINPAKTKVCDNNDTKFSTSRALIALAVDHYKAKGIECYIAEVEYEGDMFYTCRRLSDDKVMKPTTFEPVDLKSCVPVEFQGGK